MRRAGISFLTKLYTTYSAGGNETKHKPEGFFLDSVACESARAGPEKQISRMD